MRNLNPREGLTKKEPIRISKDKVQKLCQSNYHGTSGSTLMHTREVFSDGWTRWVCLTCGQVKFSRGITVKKDK